MTDLQRVEAKLDTLLSIVQAQQPKVASHTITGAAKILNVSRWTLQRWINAGRIRKVKGRIPHEQLTPFLS